MFLLYYLSSTIHYVFHLSLCYFYITLLYYISYVVRSGTHPTQNHGKQYHTVE
jgi:hypothetical protein